MEALKRELEECKESMKKMKTDQDKHTVFMEQLKDKIECPVCMEVPRRSPVPVCPNGHFVCSKCKAESCPSCRTNMGPGQSLLATIVIENIEHRCKFVDCVEKFTLGDVDKHEETCHYRTVCCPKENCREKMSLSKLIDHLAVGRCSVDSASTLLEADKNSDLRHYIMNETFLEQKNIIWPMHIYSYDGVEFGIFPKKSGGCYYFAVVMFTSRRVSSNYKVEMVVLERGSVPFDSQCSFRFLGSPISIDAKKEELDYFAINEVGMDQILKKSKLNRVVSVPSFSFSFTISKKY